jgi:hypothetical protein
MNKVFVDYFKFRNKNRWEINEHIRHDISSTKFLGLIIDDSLSWRNHIAQFEALLSMQSEL